MAQDKFDTFLENPTDSSNDLRNVDIMPFLAPLRELVGIFKYPRADEVIRRIDVGAAATRFQLQPSSYKLPTLRGVSAH